MTTSQEIQELLQQAENVLEAALEKQAAKPWEDTSKLQLTLAVLRCFRAYGASGNAIPGFRGLGLTELTALAEAVILHKPQVDKDLKIHSFKGIADSIQVSS